MNLASLQLLVVDDMSSMRMMINAVSHESGIVDVKEAGDGVRAMELPRAAPFDLVL